MKTYTQLLISLALVLGVAPICLADGFNVGYAVLYEGTGGHNLSITNVTINGNVGVGGTGAVQFGGPGTIDGSLSFSAANTGQFSNSNGSNVGPSSVAYNASGVTSALASVNLMSTTLGGESGAAIVINGNTVINASAGILDASGDEVFDVTSYSENDGQTVTINGNGHNVVLNFLGNSNVNLGGDVLLTGGLTANDVLWNFDSTSTENISLNNNASSYPLPDAFMGIILAPDDVISLTNANLDGSVYGGDSSDMHIVSGTTINSTVSAPEPSTLSFLATALIGLLGLAAWHKTLLA